MFGLVRFLASVNQLLKWLYVLLLQKLKLECVDFYIQLPFIQKKEDSQIWCVTHMQFQQLKGRGKAEVTWVWGHHGHKWIVGQLVLQWNLVSKKIQANKLMSIYTYIYRLTGRSQLHVFLPWPDGYSEEHYKTEPTWLSKI